jgi:hypothetical protein
MTANELSKRFLKWWQEQNPSGRIFRNNSGTAWNVDKNGKKYPVRFGLYKGSSDFVAFAPIEEHSILDIKIGISMRTEFYEIKTAKDKMSKDQIKFANMITSLGGDYFIVHESNTKQQMGLAEIGIKFNLCTEWFYLEKWQIK